MDLYNIRSLLSQGKSIYDLPLKVTFYARVSTDREEQINSLENQIMYFENLIKKESNWTYIDGYVDEGISGTSTKKREKFLKMIDDGKNGKFELILTKEISRFARDTLDSITYTRQLLCSGIGIYFLNDNINTFDADAELRLTIMASIAQDEIRKLSERVKFGYKRSIERGILPGNDNIYGYVKDKSRKGKLLIVPEEAELIKLIFKIYTTENIGTNKLGHKLYKEYGIKSATNRALSGTVIARIISNPKYKGFFCAHKETTLDYHTKKRKRFKPEEWIVYKDNDSCPPIVSEEMWEMANKILKSRSLKHKCKNHGDGYSMYPLSGKIICAKDKATFVRGSYTKRKTEEKMVYWGCSNYRKYGKWKKDGCSSPIIHIEEMESICNKILKTIIKNQDELMLEINDLIYEEKNIKTEEKDTKQQLSRMKELENQKDELIKMRMRKEIATEEYNKYKEEIDNQIISLKKIVFTNEINFDKKKSLSKFKEYLDNLLIKNDKMSSLRIVENLFKTIYVEIVNKNETEKDTILHIKLNINGFIENNLSLNEFLLLFSNNNRCYVCHSRKSFRDRRSICP